MAFTASAWALLPSLPVLPASWAVAWPKSGCRMGLPMQCSSLGTERPVCEGVMPAATSCRLGDAGPASPACPLVPAAAVEACAS